jgi:DNA-binding MarR family transcriptional regulator
MVTHDYQIHIFLHQTSLKRYFRETYNVTWTEFLVLVAVRKIEENNGFVASSSVIAKLQLNKDWVYKAISNLEQKNYLEIAKSKNPWRANGLSTSVGGRIILTGAEMHISERASA